MQPLDCVPIRWDWCIPIKKSILCHDIRDQNVSKDSKFEDNPCMNGTEICFRYCNFYQFPSATSIIKHCPQITSMVIQISELYRIVAADFKGFQCLKELRIQFCYIEHLPGDLFNYTPNLEVISFYKNKIKSVGEDLLTPLRSLKYFNLCCNTGIDYCFNSFKNQGTLQELKSKLSEIKTFSELRDEIVALTTRCNDLENQLKEARDETKEAHKSIEILRNQVVHVMQETAMNFVVIVNGKEFKAHKHLLKAHSKVIEKLIDESPTNEVLVLAELSEAVFAEILKFIHLGCSPNVNVDLVELFNASCRLEIEALTPIVARILHEKVNPENALKVLILCKKYKDHEKLKAKAFSEFKKNFPHFTINPELSSDPEKLKQILKTKIEMDKLLANK